MNGFKRSKTLNIYYRLSHSPRKPKKSFRSCTALPKKRLESLEQKVLPFFPSDYANDDVNHLVIIL